MMRARPPPDDSCSSPDTSSCGDAGSSGSDDSPGAPFRLRINLAACKYPVLRVVQRQLGWVEVADEAAHLFWCDTSAGTERLARLARPQRLNHFPGMLELARKKGLARNLAHMRALAPEHYDFTPEAFLLPEQRESFMAALAAGCRPAKGARGGGGQGGAARRRSSGGGSGGGQGGRATWILKLDNGSMGRGIKLVQTPAQVAAALPTFEHENLCAARYIDRPLLIHGLKFDLRLYVLVRCCAPLRVFLYREGLVRFCTRPYAPPAPANLGDAYSHLTNYAVNKQNPEFVFNQDAAQGGSGSKWTLSAFAAWMAGAGQDFSALWAQIRGLVAKSLVAVQPMLQYQYACATRPDDPGTTCFELLGYDVLVDQDLRPWLLEVNHSPSLTTDTPLDLELKSRLIRETLELAGVQPERVAAELAAQEAAKQQRLYGTHHTTSAVPHAAAAAAPAAASPGAGTAAAAAAACRDQEGSGQRQPHTPPCPAGGSGCGLLGPAEAAAPEPPRGSAEWLAAQAAYEDTHLGRFERVMPPTDPEQAALYERLQDLALQAFYKTTMQGRNLAILEGIRERRAAEAAEARAREEAQLRRAEGLRAWMAAVCQRHREERELSAAAAAAAGPDTCAAGGGGLAATCSSAGSGSDAGSDGATAAAVAALQQHFAAARQALATPQAPAAAASAAAQHRSPGRRAGRAGPGAACQASSKPAGISLSIVGKSAAAGPDDSARTSAAGGLPAVEAPGSSRRRPLSAGCQPSRARTATVEEVIEQRQAAAAAAGERGAWPPTRPPTASGSAALAAWEALTARSHQPSSVAEAAAVLSPGRCPAAASLAAAPWQEAVWESYGRPAGARPPSGSSRFLERVATFTAAQQGLQATATAAVAAERAQAELAELRLSSSGSSLADSATSHGSSGSTSCGARGVPLPLLGSLVSAGPDGGSAAPYLPPALLSALHTVRMSPGLLSGLRPAPPAAGAVQQWQQRRKAGSGSGSAAVASPNGGCSAGTRGARSSRVLLDAPLTAASGLSPAKRAGGAGSPQAKALSGAQRSPASGSPCAPVAGPGSSGSPAGARRQYKAAVEQQAVQSVAALISDLIQERRL